MGTKFSQGTVVAGGNGLGSNLNQLYYPNGFFVNDNGDVYISDGENERIVKWEKDAVEGTVVAGGYGSGGDLNQFHGPHMIYVDDEDTVYILDNYNERIMKWTSIVQGEIIFSGYELRDSKDLHWPPVIFTY